MRNDFDFSVAMSKVQLATHFVRECSMSAGAPAGPDDSGLYDLNVNRVVGDAEETETGPVCTCDLIIDAVDRDDESNRVRLVVSGVFESDPDVSAKELERLVLSHGGDELYAIAKGYFSILISWSPIGVSALPSLSSSAASASSEG